MKNGKIYWVLQKLYGLVLLLVSIIFFDFIIVNEIGLILVLFIPMGLWLLLTKKKVFFTDYIFDINEFLKK